MRIRKRWVAGFLVLAAAVGGVSVWSASVRQPISLETSKLIEAGMSLQEVERIIGCPADFDSRGNPFPIRNPYGRYVLGRQFPKDFGFAGAPRHERRERTWASCGLRRAFWVQFDADDRVERVTYGTLQYRSSEPFVHALYRWLGL